jgi:hypothetical protein
MSGGASFAQAFARHETLSRGKIKKRKGEKGYE